MASAPERTIHDLVFVGFSSKVVALDRFTGETVWEWKCPEGSGYVSLLVDVDRLIVSVVGYMYCLDPVFGQEVWRNPLKGMGTGVASLASIHATQLHPNITAAAAATSQQAASGAAAAT